MTRDQANQIVDSIKPNSATNWLVECLEVLGVLRFESTDVTSYEVVHCLAGQSVVVESSHGFASGAVTKLHASGGFAVLEALDRAGFKVVRK